MRTAGMEAPAHRGALRTMVAMTARLLIVTGVAAVGTAAFLVSTPVRVQADASSSPGKFAAAATLTNVDLTTDPDPVSATIQLAKGKAKRLLIVNVTAATDTYDGRITIAPPMANGINLEPQSSFAGVDCRDIDHCSAAGTWWMDLDVAEAANPGSVVGVPLTVVVNVSPLRIGPHKTGENMTLAVVAQQVKK